jgi:rhodanese-related sulfurtransferase
MPPGCGRKEMSLPMAAFRPLLLVSACCLFLGESVSAQTTPAAVRPAGTGAYFQTLVREARSRIREISVVQLRTLRSAMRSPVLVDVREDNEWNRSRIPGAVHVGRGVLEVSIESRIPLKSTPLIVYCQGGGRSAVAADVLGRMGYTNVASLAGGLAAYQAAGLRVDQGPPPK